MSTIVSDRGTQPWFRRLYLPAYSVRDAARYAGISPQTVANWHYRHTALGPALPGREHRKPVSYLQLIEVAVVAVFRAFGVPLNSIRKTRQYMAQTFNAEYPFAEYCFKTDGYHLLMNLHEFEPNVNVRGLIVADKGGQLGWERMMQDRLYEFDYEYELALRWHPAGRASLVIIDPRIAFGAPMVSGLPTWVLKGRYDAGEDINEIIDDFSLPYEAVRDGLHFEGVKLNGDSVLG